MRLLDDEGLTSVVATNCEQHYGRPLVVGDRLIVARSSRRSPEPKRPGSAPGASSPPGMTSWPCPTPTCRWRGRPADAGPGALRAGEPVATMRFRILKYLPPATETAAAPAAAPAGHHPGQRLLVRGRPRSTSCSSSAAPRAGPCATRPCRPAPPAGPSSGTPSSRGAGASCTQLRGRPLPAGARASTTRCPSGWSSWRRGHGWWPTWTASSPAPCDRHGAEGRVRRLRRRADPAGLRARLAGGGGLMDFNFTEEQLAVSRGGRRVFAGLVDPERIGAVEADRRPHRPRRCGGPWPPPTSSAWPSPSPTAAPATG